MNYSECYNDNVKRVTLFCGHYGSGKTNIAVNYAKYIKEKGHDVAIADLDIVNPYFRTKDSEEELKELGIKLISLPFAGTNVDLPAMPSEMYSIVQLKDRYNVLDIGGDDRGAYALGRIADYIVREGNYECLYVVNFLRPLTSDAESAAEVLEEIQEITGIPFTGIVNNTNLGAETTAETVLASQSKAAELSELTGLNVLFTSAEARVAAEINNINNQLFPMILQKRPVDI